MVITDIERQKKNPRRYNIYIDGEFAIGLDRNVILDHGLRKGDAIDDKLLTSLQTADELVRAYQIALRFLSYRPRSESEIRTRLEREKLLPQTIDEVISKLYQERQLDDHRFAELYAESKMLSKPIGAHRLRLELRQKGIKDEIITGITNTYCDEESELHHARRLAEKKLSSDRTNDPLKQKRHLADHLARRGFGWDVIRRILDEIAGNG